MCRVPGTVPLTANLESDERRVQTRRPRSSLHCRLRQGARSGNGNRQRRRRPQSTSPCVPQHPPGEDSRRGTTYGTAPDLFFRARACLPTLDWRAQKDSSCVEQRRLDIGAIRAYRLLELHVLSDLFVVGYDDC